MKAHTSKEFELLRASIEEALCRRIQSPKDFRFLSEQIYGQTRDIISPTTLKRLWGYLAEDVNPHESTLSILARFTGYASWNDFRAVLTRMNGQVNEQPLYAPAVMGSAMRRGGRLSIHWQPDSHLILVCLGNSRFEVCESCHSLLGKGDTLDIGLAFRGKPLYVTNIRSSQIAHPSMIIAPKTGVNIVVV